MRWIFYKLGFELVYNFPWPILSFLIYFSQINNLMLYDHCHTNFMSSFRAGFHLSFISADISWLVFPNTVMASIRKITNVLGSEGCC